MINSGISVQSKDKLGKTPLHVAIEANNVEICKLLVSNGAKVDAYDNNNVTPRDMAMHSSNREIVQLIYHPNIQTADPRFVPQ